MENSYECPRCHNIFPNSNKTLHDLRCTEENPMPLDKSRIIEQSANKENKDIKKEEEEKIIKEEKKEEIKPVQNQIRKPPSGEFPEVFECNICHQVLMEKERKDHMYCHNLVTEDNNRQNELKVSEEEIKRQKLIEKQIERDNRMNQRNNERNNNERNNNERNNNRNNNFPFFQNLGSSDFDTGNSNSDLGINNFLNNLGNAISRQQMSNMNNFENNNNNNNNQHRNNNNVNSNVIFEYSSIGPNGERIVRRYQGGDPQNQNQQEMPNMFFNLSNNRNRSNRIRNISINDLSSGFLDNFFNEFLQRMGSRENPTDEDILNELPETQIEDVNKLDPEKKNCIICLEDFKNGDKAIILPCIHLFHNECIKNWLKTQNTCPICKFKLTGENMGQSNQ